MASNNNELVFYQQWAVAGLQMDKYSTNPWCVDSKNLDIFSDSQSVKGTAWSEPTQIEPVEWIDEDERGRFRLYADGTVYDSVEDVTYDHTYYDAHAETINWKDWSAIQAQPFWTPRKIFVKYVWDEWNMIVVITDTLKYYIPNGWIRINMKKQFTDGNNVASFDQSESENDYYSIKYRAGNTYWWWNILPSMTSWRIKFDMYCDHMNDIAEGTIDWFTAGILNYDPQTKRLKDQYANRWVKLAKFTYDYDTDTTTITASSDDPNVWTVTLDWTYMYVDTFISWHIMADQSWWWNGLRIQAKPTTYWDAKIRIPDCYINEFWEYLKPSEKEVIEIDDKWFIKMDENEYQEAEWMELYDADWNPYYTLAISWTFTVPEGQDIVAIAKSFDYRLVFANKTEDNIWIIYYVPAGDDILTFSQGWEYPWMKFINATMINWYAYFIAENRWIRGLYIFYNWQIKKIASSDIRYTEAMSLMDWKQIYDFTWPMFNWRWHVVAPTKNWVYMYWENKRGQNVWSFILKVGWDITKLLVDDNNKLRVEYTIWANNYYKLYQDDINIKTYESEFSITYPVQISSHILEKEPLKLAVSYDIPNSNTSMDVYLSVNDYHFWSFLTDWTVEPEVWDKFKVSWLSWDYWLIFVEKNWNWLTFTLDGDLPYQSSNTTNLVSEDNSTTIGFSDINHFKKIWTISKTSPQEKIGKHTLLNISNGNDLPIVRKAQVKIVWKTDTHVSPLLYDVRFLSTQLDK